MGRERKSNVSGTISVHVNDLLISGSGKFLLRITQITQLKFGADPAGRDESIYLRMRIKSSKWRRYRYSTARKCLWRQNKNYRDFGRERMKRVNDSQPKANRRFRDRSWG